MQALRSSGGSIWLLRRALPNWIPLAFLLAASLPVRADAEPNERADVFSPDAKPYGESYETWAARLLQWSLAFPATANPAADTAPPETGQSGRVWFLATVTGNRTVTRSMTVPAHKALFLAALSIRSNNTECPIDTDFSVDELFERAENLWDIASETSVTIDGVPVPDLDDPQTTPYLVHAGPFPITLADHDNQLAAGGQTCVPDGATIDPNVAIGAVLMVKPLPVGSHTIRIRGVAGPADDPVFVKDVTYQIEVVRP
jgi:hypothetical protein